MWIFKFGMGLTKGAINRFQVLRVELWNAYLFSMMMCTSLKIHDKKFIERNSAMTGFPSCLLDVEALSI